MESAPHDVIRTSAPSSQEPPRNGGQLSDEQRQQRMSEALWPALGELYAHRKLIAAVTAAIAVAAVVISLLLPNWYQAEARVLLPDSPGGALSAVLGRVSPAAASLLGSGGGGDYARFLAILTSRTALERVADEFDLAEVYETADARYPREATLKELRENVAFTVDMDYDFLSIAVGDPDPERAARMANFLVAELNRVNGRLAAENASNFRRYVQKRYEESLADLDSARAAMLRFQQRHGVLELPTMAEAFLQSAATQRADAIRNEIQYEALRAQYGTENPQVQAAEQAVRAARRKEAELLGGGDPLMPVPLQDLPEVGSEYARLYQDLLMQSEILQVVQPLYEQARFEEERDREAVQVVDMAVPPERKAWPKRSLIVIGATLSAFILAVCFVLIRASLRRNGGALAARFRAAVSS